MGIFGKLFRLAFSAAPEVLPEQAILIDVRSPSEFAAAHIKGAISLPLNCVVQGIGSVVTDRTIPVIVYCQSGARSAAARKHLLDMGYSHVINGGGLQVLSSRMNREILR
jgi:phage shock protein E